MQEINNHDVLRLSVGDGSSIRYAADADGFISIRIDGRHETATAHIAPGKAVTLLHWLWNVVEPDAKPRAQ